MHKECAMTDGELWSSVLKKSFCFFCCVGYTTVDFTSATCLSEGATRVIFKS